MIDLLTIMSLPRIPTLGDPGVVDLGFWAESSRTRTLGGEEIQLSHQQRLRRARAESGGGERRT